jgi:lipopolysaccharide biosynthesis glycosyltransferase
MTSTSTGPLHIALTFDDNFWAPAYATMRSICLTTKRRKDLVFHLIHSQLTAEHRADLDAISDEFGATLVDHLLDDDRELLDFVATLPHSKSLPPIVYARLFLEHYIPADAERFLFIDCDVYVRAPIEKLINIDLEGHPIAAAPEPGRHHLMKGDDMRTFNKPFDLSDSYFNAGVIVIDRAKWVAADLPGTLREHVRTGLMADLYQDQDVLNLRIKDDWKELDPRWNLTKPHPALRSLDPYIVHYTTGQKPWNSIAFVAFNSSYRHVMTRDLFKRYRKHRWERRIRGWRNRFLGLFGAGAK